MAHKKLLENEDQFIVSYELLYILQWLVTYERAAFAELIRKAFLKGSQDQNYATNLEQTEEAEYLQNSVIEFFNFLQQEVVQVSENEAMKEIIQTNLLKTLDHIDAKIFDPAIIKASMMATAEKVHPLENKQAKDYFLKQLLKKWTPKKEKNKKHTRH
jgi:hypothetical protein